MSNDPRASNTFAATFLAEVQEIAGRLDAAAIEHVAARLAAVRERGGRLFILGVGGSAANASHAVNDFRKLSGFEAYAPTDNVSELTARANDEGWATVFAAWLQGSRLSALDAVLVFSVGGGSLDRNISPNIVVALQHAKAVGATILGIVGRDGGYTAQVADACVIVPSVESSRITPHAEAFQAVVWHLLVSHPALQRAATKWESVASAPRRRAVFLDRDGVLNDAIVREGQPYPPATVGELRIPPGTAEALARLKALGLLLVVVSNQPDVARGTQTRAQAEAITHRVREALPIDDVFTCFHDDGDQCDCRKPRTGLITSAAALHGIDLGRSYLVGDRWRDIDAGASAGCTTIWIDRGYAERGPASPPSARVKSLADAVAWITSHATVPS